MADNESSKTKDVKVRGLPIGQFELAGQQLDNQHFKQALSRLLGRVSLVLFSLLLVFMLWKVIPAMKVHKNMLGKLDRNVVNKFEDKILLRVLSTERSNEVTVFGIIPKKAREGFVFVLVTVSVTNNHADAYPLNPNLFSLETNDGDVFPPHGLSRKVSGALRHKQVRSGRTVEGKVLFEIKASQRPDRILIRGLGGPVAERDAS